MTTSKGQWTVTRAQMKAIRAEAAKVNAARRELDAKWKAHPQADPQARAEYSALIAAHEARSREILG